MNKLLRLLPLCPDPPYPPCPPPSYHPPAPVPPLWLESVNKSKKCCFFSMTPFPFSFFQFHLDVISSHIEPSSWSFLSHQIFPQLFFCLSSTYKSPSLLKGRYFSLDQKNCVIPSGGGNELGDKGDLTCRQTRHRHFVILPFGLYESEIATFWALRLTLKSLGW